MAKQTVVDVSPQAANGPTGLERAALEQRLQRLEDALASLIEMKASQQSAAVAAITSQPPIAVPQPPREPPLTPVTTPASSAHVQRHFHLPTFDFLREIRALPSMFFDRRYRVGWAAKLAVFVLVPLLLTSQWWLPLAWVPVVGPILDKIFVVLVAYAGYRALSREAQRYLLFKTANMQSWQGYSERRP